MSLNAQSSLFGEGGMTPPRRSAGPDPESIRHRLERLLDTLRAAEGVMPLSERDLRMWQTVLPNMTKWLSENEARRIHASFSAEIERLTVAERASPISALPRNGS
jgi:hypothetical protein